MLYGIDTHLPGPMSLSSAAVSSQASALRAVMYTSAPADTKPSAIMRPMPRLPPVTTAVLPATEKQCVDVHTRRI